jgi:hypothetical protein
MSLMKIGGYGINNYQTQGTITTIARACAASSGFTSLGSNLVKITCSAAHGFSFTPTAPEFPVAFVKLGGTISGQTGTGTLVNNVFRVVALGTGSNSITVGGTTTNLANTDIVIYTTVTAATVGTSTTVQACYFPYFIAASLTTTASPNSYNSVSTTYTPYNASQGTATAFITGTNGVNSGTPGSNVSIFANVDNTLVPLDNTTGNTPGTAPSQLGYLTAAYVGGTFNFGPGDYLAVNGVTGTQTCYVSIIA